MVTKKETATKKARPAKAAKHSSAAPKKAAPAKAAKRSNAAAKKSAPLSFTYKCSFFKQRKSTNAPSFCLFAAAAGDVLKWADIERLGPGVKGVQRRENAGKRKQIKRFFENDPDNTIPTAIIIAFDKTLVHSSDSELTVPLAADNQRKVGLVIDGQHRLLGISDYDAKVEVPIVAILDADDVEKAFQFLVINNKGSKVSQNHIKALALNYKEKALTERLKTAKLALDNERLIHVEILNTAEDSPFQHRVKFPTTTKIKGKDKHVVPEAFEKALQYIEASRLPKLEDSDVQRDFFVAVWRTIVDEWGESEAFAEECKLTDKVGLICMTRYVVDKLAALVDLDLDNVDLDLSDSPQVEAEVRKLLNRQTIDFWTVDWKGSGYDTGIGHTKVIENLNQIQRNLRAGKEWTMDLDILKST